MEKKNFDLLRKIIVPVWGAMIFLLPIFFYPWGIDMFEVPKNALLRLLISVIIAAYALHFSRTGKLKLFYSKGSLYFTAFLLFALALSLITSVWPSVSFWGSFYRQGGGVNMLLYIALFWISFQIFQLRQAERRFFEIVAFSGLIVSIYAIFQKAGLDFFPAYATEMFAGRSFSAIGNPTFLGAYLIFPFWSAWMLFSESSKKKRWAYFFALTLIITALLTTVNRATMLALMLTGAVSLLIRFRKSKKAVAGLLGAGVILSASFLAVYAQDLRSINARLSIWQSSVEMIQERPIFGTGLESFAWRFEEKAKPGFFQHTDYYNLADRPHNEPMEMWIHLGILGLILYLVFFGLVLREAFRSRGRRHYAALAILTLLVSNFFSFSMTIHYFFLALFASFLFSDKAKAASFKFNRAGKLVSLLLLGMAASTVFWSARLMASNHQLSQAILEINENHHEKAMAIMEAALENSPPYADLYSFAFDQLYAIILRTHSEIAFGKAAEINQAYSALSQNNLKSRLNLAKIHMIGGENEKAEAAFKSIASQKAAQPLVYEYWANFYHGTGQHKKAALVYDRLLELMPRSWKSKPFEPQSLTDAQRIFWKNHPEFMVSLENAAESYSMTEQEGKAQFILSLVQ